MKTRGYFVKITVIAIIIVVVALPSLRVSTNQPTSNSYIHKMNEMQYSSSSQTIHTVTFSEKGLKQGVRWYVSVGESELNLMYPTLSSTTNIIDFNGYPGNYTMHCWADGNYVTSLMAPQQFTITGSSYTLNTTFYETFPVTVEVQGIPANFSWSYSLRGSPTIQYLFDQSATYYNGSKQVQYVVNGTYSLFAGEQLYYDLDIYSIVGNVTVNGEPINLNLSFNRFNLSATGLPENTSWGFYGSDAFQLANGSMYLPNGLYPGKEVNVTFYLPNGRVHLRPVAKGYYAKELDINITSRYTNATVNFLKEYPVTFNGKGANQFMQEWQINGIPYAFDGTPLINGVRYSQTYMIPNGTYNASVVFPFGSSTYVKINGTDYSVKIVPNPANQTVTVAGKPLSVNLTFTVIYTKYVSPMNKALVASIFVGGILGTLATLIGIVATVEYLKRRR